MNVGDAENIAATASSNAEEEDESRVRQHMLAKYSSII
jgi:hypothetical protein